MNGFLHNKKSLTHHQMISKGYVLIFICQKHLHLEPSIFVGAIHRSAVLLGNLRDGLKSEAVLYVVSLCGLREGITAKTAASLVTSKLYI